MIGAFSYLILTSARNRVRAQVARLRNPRYAIALAFGLFYVWGVYLRPARHTEVPPTMLGGTIGVLAPLLALAYVAWPWLFGGDRSALAFTEAEATILFTAPVSRRTLVLYKIARSQLAILTTSILWTVLFRRGPNWPLALTHIVGFWVVLSTLNLYRLGVALVRASSGTHGLAGARRSWLPVALFAAVVAMVVASIWAARDQLRDAEGIGEMGDVLAGALTSMPAALALFPFTILLAPLGAPPGVEWVRAMGPALLLLALVAAWVLRTDASFEEAAAEASTALARRIATMRSRRGSGAAAPITNTTRSIPLRPTGPPAVALLWKNAVWLLRTGQLRGLVGPPAVSFLCIALFAARSSMAAMVIAVVSLLLAVMMLMLGPLSMRNDLRSELLHLSLLKTLPLRGRDIVLAEVASSALPIAVMQYLLVLAGLVALAFTERADTDMDASLRAALVLASPLVILGLNGATFMIHNGLALLFPAWVKLGATSGAGIETLGMAMITMMIVLVMLALMLIAPAAAGALLWFLLRDHLAAAVFSAGIAAGVLLLGESAAFAVVLGRALDRVEPTQVG